jgi:hypothetical protein
MADTPTAASARQALARFSACNRDEQEALATLRAYLALAEKDAQRLDSGCIVTNDRDEFGEEYITERRGLDLRAAIDAAIAARTQQAGKEGT